METCVNDISSFQVDFYFTKYQNWKAIMKNYFLEFPK